MDGGVEGELGRGSLGPSLVCSSGGHLWASGPETAPMSLTLLQLIG